MAEPVCCSAKMGLESPTSVTPPAQVMSQMCVCVTGCCQAAAPWVCRRPACSPGTRMHSQKLMLAACCWSSQLESRNHWHGMLCWQSASEGCSAQVHLGEPDDHGGGPCSHAGQQCGLCRHWHCLCSPPAVAPAQVRRLHGAFACSQAGAGRRQ